MKWNDVRAIKASPEADLYFVDTRDRYGTTQDQLGKVHRFLWTCRHLPDPHGAVLREALEWGLRQGMSRGGASGEG